MYRSSCVCPAHRLACWMVDCILSEINDDDDDERDSDAHETYHITLTRTCYPRCVVHSHLEMNCLGVLLISFTGVCLVRVILFAFCSSRCVLPQNVVSYGPQCSVLLFATMRVLLSTIGQGATDKLAQIFLRHGVTSCPKKQATVFCTTVCPFFSGRVGL